jgi:hypothetical protein
MHPNFVEWYQIISEIRRVERITVFGEILENSAEKKIPAGNYYDVTRGSESLYLPQFPEEIRILGGDKVVFRILINCE